MLGNYVQRFLFEDLDIRGRLVVLNDAWREMTEGRNYAANIADLLGNTVTVCTLLGANRKGRQRTTLQVRGSGPVSLLVADCSTDLKIRGMASAQPGATGDIGTLFGDGRLALTLEDTTTGRMYQSIVPLDGSTLGEVFEHYLSQSEQVQSLLALRSGPDAQCGLLLEKLPGADGKDADGWNRVSQLAATLTLDEASRLSPSDLLVRIFPEELLRVFPLDTVEYHCPYDPDKVRDMLRSLGRDEVESMLTETGEIVIRNEMCNHEYRFGRAEVDALFAAGASD